MGRFGLAARRAATRDLLFWCSRQQRLWPRLYSSSQNCTKAPKYRSAAIQPFRTANHSHRMRGKSQLCGTCFLRSGILRVGFDCNVNLCAFLELHFPSLSILQGIINANLAVKVIGALNRDFRFFGYLRVKWLNDALHPSGLGCLGLLGHFGPQVSWEKKAWDTSV